MSTSESVSNTADDKETVNGEADYREVTKDVYAEAAKNPDSTLCCVDGSEWALPGLNVPDIMYAMNYGCGSTVSPQDLKGDGTVLYIGVGGGLEALQFAYFRRRKGGVIAVDPVGPMRDRARENLIEAARLNDWFEPDFVTILDGDASTLPVDDKSVHVVAQNCLFNIFKEEDLTQALSEVARVLVPGGRFSTSDPITPVTLPQSLQENAVLRARCLSGCLTYEDYLGTLARAGLTKIQVRSRRPYRYLVPSEFPELSAPIKLESIEVVAFKTQPGSKLEIFSGRTVTYVGADETSKVGCSTFHRGVPISVSDGTADKLGSSPDFAVSGSTFGASSTGCC